MNINIRKTLFSFFLILIGLPILGQDHENLEIKILNSSVVKKKKQDAVKLSVQFSNIGNTTDTLLLYGILKFPPTNAAIIDTTITMPRFKDGSTGILYLVEDSLGIISGDPHYPPSFVHIEDEIESLSDKMVADTHKLKLKRIKCTATKQMEEFEKRFVLTKNEPLIVNLYPLIDYDFGLEPGKYKLFLFYAFNNPWISGEYTIFNGWAISNKVDLIIK